MERSHKKSPGVTGDKTQPARPKQDRETQRPARPRSTRRRPDSALFKLLLENIREGAAVMDAKGHLLFANDRLAEMLHLECDRVVEKSLVNFVLPEDRSGLARILQDGGENDKLRVRLTGGNAFPLPVELSVTRMLEHAGSALCVVAVDLSRRRRAEEQLAFQAHLLANISDAVVATDEEFRIMYWNAAAERLYGYTAEEVLGRPAYEVFRSEKTVEERAAFARDLQANGQMQVESLHYDRHGKQLLVKSSHTLLRTPRGNLLGYLSVLCDIAEQRRAEAQLRASEERYRNLNADLERRVVERTADLEQANRVLQIEIAERQRAEQALLKRETTFVQAEQMAHLGAWDIEFYDQDNLNNNPLTWSDEVYRIFGYAPGEVQASNELFFERVHPEDRPRVADAVAQAVATRQPYGIEHRVVRPDGEVRIVQEHAFVFFDERGKPARIIGAVQDITDRKRIEEEVRRTREEYQLLVEDQMDMVARMSREGKRLYVNPNFAHLIGKSQSEIVSTDFAPELHPDDQARVAEEWKKTFEPPHYRSEIEARTFTPHGWRWLSWRNRAILDEHGEPATAISVGRDVTEQKLAAESLQQAMRELIRANKELESFSYSVSHDLRAPLASIDGFSRLLQEDFGAQLPAQAQRYLDLIRSGTQQMDALITSLLALSRLSRQALKKERVNMTKLVMEALETMQSEPLREDLTLDIQDLPDADADPVLLKQVWVNLITNALKFTRKRDHPRIQVGARVPTKARGQTTGGLGPPSTVYYITDNGVGFDMAQADRLFGVFQRLHPEEDYEGTGVGLATVARIINRHGGRVWAEGQVNQGATFYFTLG